MVAYVAGKDGIEGALALLDRADAMAAALTADAMGRLAAAEAADIAGWLDNQAELL